MAGRPPGPGGLPVSRPQPPRGSVVLTEGPRGTAWQRFFSDGRWHSVTGKSTSWERLLRADRPGAPVLVVYTPPADSNTLE